MTVKRSLSEFISEINNNRKTGLLSITVSGANTLLKLFFRDGELYHLTCGNIKGAECLAQVAGGDFAEYFFMPNMVLTVHDEKLPSLPDIMRLCNAADSAIEVSPLTGKSGGQTTGGRGGGDLPSSLESLTLALIRQIGPAGSKVMSRTVEKKWQASSPPTRQELLQLVDLLKDEIENPDDRNAFLAEAGAVLT